MRHLVPRLLRRGGHDRRPPGAQGGLAAGARSSTGSSATTGTTTAPCSCRTPSTSCRPSASRGRSRSRSRSSARSTTARPTATTSSCAWARWPTSTPSTSRARSPFWNEVMKHGTYDEFWKARNLRPHLKNIKPAVLTVGGWFDAENLFGALETLPATRGRQPRREQRPGHGAVDPRRLERRPGDGASLGHVSVRRQDRRVLPREDRAAVLRVPPQGQGRRSSRPKALGLRDGHEPLARVRDLAAEGTRSR